MKLNLLLRSSLLLTAVVAQADLLTVGTPGNSQLSTPTGPSPTLNTLINFDGLTPFSTFVPGTYAAMGVSSISSPDGLLVIPFSTQSFPNELYDESSNGTANISIDLSRGVNAIGIGVADSDPVSITLQALNSSGTPFGTLFTENLAATESTVNTGNGYYVLSDTTNDIFGLQIKQTAGNVNYSGLAIDDLQITPEPSSFIFLALCGTVFVCFRMRHKRA